MVKGLDSCTEMTDEQIERVLATVNGRLRKRFRDQWHDLEDVVAHAVVLFLKSEPQGSDSQILNLASLKATSACLKAIAANTRQAGDRARLEPRPRLQNKENKNFVLSLRVRADLRVKLESRLRDRGLSVSEYMEDLLRQALEDGHDCLRRERTVCGTCGPECKAAAAAYQETPE